MSLNELSTRIAQILGFLVGLTGAALWAGLRYQIPVAADVSRSFKAAGGNSGDALLLALIGFVTFLVCTALLKTVRG